MRTEKIIEKAKLQYPDNKTQQFYRVIKPFIEEVFATSNDDSINVDKFEDRDTGIHVVRQFFKCDNQDYCKTIMVNSILYAYGLGYIDMYKLSMLRRCLEEVFANGCYSLRQLAINGNDLIELGLKPGPVITLKRDIDRNVSKEIAKLH